MSAMKKRRQVSSQRAKPSKTPEQPLPASRNNKIQQSVPQPGPEPTPRPLQDRLWVQILALLCVAAFGLWVRLEDLSLWNREPGRAFFQGEPLLTALDGLFYLTLARDLAEGTYHSIDEKRSVPDYPPRPSPPPLISVLTAAVTKVLPISINWVAVLLPAVLGVSILFPVFGLGKFFGGPLAGIVAALMALLPPYYVYRSGLGWLDTDCLNVTFATAAAYFFLKFGVTTTYHRYYHFLAALLNLGLCLWWWDQTPQVVTVICLAPLGVAIVFFYRPERRERWIFFGTLASGVLILLMWKGTAFVSHFIAMLGSQFSYIAKESAGTFPNIGVSISEQVKPSFEAMVTISSGNLWTFLAALAGFAWLVWKHWKESLFLGVLFGLSVLAFVYARRFAIFCIPLVALGIGFLIAQMWRLRNNWKILSYVTPCFLALLIWPMVEINHAQTYWPKEQPPLISGLALAEKQTPPDAVIWAWWDHGYTIPYWARRASVNDGSVHSGERTYFNGLPLATDNERFAANFMQFYVARGITGMEKLYSATGSDQDKGLVLMKRVLEAGPEQARSLLQQAQLPPLPGLATTEDWLEFFFPSNPRPVYLLLDDLLTRTSYWWYWFGTWDLEKHDGIHADYKLIPNIYEENGILKSRGTGVEIDPRSGTVNVGAQVIPFEELSVWEGEKNQTKRFNHKSGIIVEVSRPLRLAVMMHRNIASSVFNRLYLRQTYSPQYFRPLALNSPWYQLWEVQGESWKAASGS